MTNPPSPDAVPPIGIEQTVERARAAWAAGRADEAEMACRQERSAFDLRELRASAEALTGRRLGCFRDGFGMAAFWRQGTARGTEVGWLFIAHV